METIETEAKFELTEQSFGQLLNEGEIAERVDQLNVYFDSSWQLANRAATFRVRLMKGKAPTLTLKLPHSADAEKRTMREFEYSLGHDRDCWNIGRGGIDVEDDLPPEIGQVLRRLGVNELTRVGWMRTHRYLLRIEGIGELELDRVRLPNGSDFFEAEIETSDDVMRVRVITWLLSRSPSAKPSTISKFERFRQSIRSVARQRLMNELVDSPEHLTTKSSA